MLFGGVRSFLRTRVFGIRRYIRIHISWQRGTDGKCRLCRRAEKLDEIQQATSRPTSRRTELRYIRSSQPAEVYSQSLYIDSHQCQDTKQNRQNEYQLFVAPCAVRHTPQHDGRMDKLGTYVRAFSAHDNGFGHSKRLYEPTQRNARPCRRDGSKSLAERRTPHHSAADRLRSPTTILQKKDPSKAYYPRVTDTFGVRYAGSLIYGAMVFASFLFFALVVFVC